MLKPNQIISCLVFFIMFLPYPNWAETVNRVVAIVNEDVITLYELHKKIKETFTGGNKKYPTGSSHREFMSCMALLPTRAAVTWPHDPLPDPASV